MYVLPVSDNQDRQAIIFVLEKDNVLRMLKGDPVTIRGGVLTESAAKAVEGFSLEKAEIVLAIASPGEKEIKALRDDGDVETFMDIVFRNHEITAEDNLPITAIPIERKTA